MVVRELIEIVVVQPMSTNWFNAKLRQYGLWCLVSDGG